MFIPGTRVPIAAVIAEQEEEQLRFELNTFQLLLSNRNFSTSRRTWLKRSAVFMQHAWLVVSRYRVAATTRFTLTLDDDVLEVVGGTNDKAVQELRAKAVDYQGFYKERVARRRREWQDAHTELRVGVLEEFKTGAFKKEIRRFDEVLIDGNVKRTGYREGQRFLDEECKRRFPEPTGPEVVATQVPEVRSWASSLVGADQTTRVPPPPGLSWSDGAPTEWIAQQLDALSREGWNLIHVSEDHGLYTGADAAHESYPTRLRFLLQRPSPE